MSPSALLPHRPLGQPLALPPGVHPLPAHLSPDDRRAMAALVRWSFGDGRPLVDLPPAAARALAAAAGPPRPGVALLGTTPDRWALLGPAEVPEGLPISHVLIPGRPGAEGVGWVMRQLRPVVGEALRRAAAEPDHPLGALGVAHLAGPDLLRIVDDPLDLVRVAEDTVRRVLEIPAAGSDARTWRECLGRAAGRRLGERLRAAPDGGAAKDAMKALLHGGAVSRAGWDALIAAGLAVVPSAEGCGAWARHLDHPGLRVGLGELWPELGPTAVASGRSGGRGRLFGEQESTPRSLGDELEPTSIWPVVAEVIPAEWTILRDALLGVGPPQSVVAVVAQAAKAARRDPNPAWRRWGELLSWLSRVDQRSDDLGALERELDRLLRGLARSKEAEASLLLAVAFASLVQHEGDAPLRERHIARLSALLRREGGSAPTAGRGWLALASLLREADDAPREEEALRNARARFGEAGDRRAEAEAWLRLAQVVGRDRPDEAEAWLRGPLLNAVNGLDDGELKALRLDALAKIRHERGDLQGALDLRWEELPLRDLGSVDRILCAHEIASLTEEVGHREAALAVLRQEAAQAAEATGDPELMLMGLHDEVELLQRMGRREEAVEIIERKAVDLTPLVDDEELVVETWFLLVELLVELRRVADARQVLETKLRPSVNGSDDPDHLEILTLFESMLLAMEGDVTGAEARLQALVRAEAAEQEGGSPPIHILRSVAKVWQTAGHPARALQIVDEQLLPRRRELEATDLLPKVEALREELLSAVAVEG